MDINYRYNVWYEEIPQEFTTMVTRHEATYKPAAVGTIKVSEPEWTQYYLNTEGGYPNVNDIATLPTAVTDEYGNTEYTYPEVSDFEPEA